ncbi:hypothetical protein Ahy_A07g035014 [Arachis hypogaea]|uniref:Uncharacterized protein n=1 Tax=Arachis hypogaea TaxID=3818 RepID=A0A445CD95_ARAHY|nr:hypothetical protein Ahy_A07g035014 [Arachis hypogaea]
METRRDEGQKGNNQNLSPPIKCHYDTLEITTDRPYHREMQQTSDGTSKRSEHPRIFDLGQKHGVAFHLSTRGRLCMLAGIGNSGCCLSGVVVAKMQQRVAVMEGAREMDDGFDQGVRDFNSQMPFAFRVQPIQPNLQERM